MADKIVVRGVLGCLYPAPGKKFTVRTVRLVPHEPFDPENPVYDEVTAKENITPYHFRMFAGKRVKITIEDTTEEE